MTKEDILLIKSMKKKYGRVSRTWIQYMFKLDSSEAEKIRMKYDKRISDG